MGSYLTYHPDSCRLLHGGLWLQEYAAVQAHARRYGHRPRHAKGQYSVPRGRDRIQEIPELVPFYVTLAGDTVREEIYVPVDITQREYRTDSYRVWVSGYRPSLDSIWVYPERIYIKEKARRWGIGLSAGYGIGKGGIFPYIGVGVYYRIW